MLGKWIFSQLFRHNYDFCLLRIVRILYPLINLPLKCFLTRVRVFANLIKWTDVWDTVWWCLRVNEGEFTNKYSRLLWWVICCLIFVFIFFIAFADIWLVLVNGRVDSGYCCVVVMILLNGTVGKINCVWGCRVAGLEGSSGSFWILVWWFIVENLPSRWGGATVVVVNGCCNTCGYCP